MLKILALIVASLTAVAAHAQVYEIGDGGTLNVREGGGVVTWRDVNAPQVAVVDVRLPPSPVAQPAAPTSYNDALTQSAARHGLSPVLLEALVWQESRWRSQAVSPKGAVGLTQLMPATAQALGVNAHDPLANLDAGARYLRLLLDHFGGDLVKALAAYNAGVARVERAGGIPPIRETQNYVASILGRLDGQMRKP